VLVSLRFVILFLSLLSRFKQKNALIMIVSTLRMVLLKVYTGFTFKYLNSLVFIRLVQNVLTFLFAGRLAWKFNTWFLISCSYANKKCIDFYKR